MNIALLVGGAIALASFAGAAYLLSLWHDDQRELEAAKTYRGIRTWTFARVLAYVSIGCTLSSNYLVIPTLLRVVEFPGFREIVAALTPFTIAALLWLDVAFVILALYLRLIRRRRRRAKTIDPLGDELKAR